MDRVLSQSLNIVSLARPLTIGPINNGHGWSLAPKLRILDWDICDSVVQCLPSSMLEPLGLMPSTAKTPKKLKIAIAGSEIKQRLLTLGPCVISTVMKLILSANQITSLCVSFLFFFPLGERASLGKAVPRSQAYV